MLTYQECDNYLNGYRNRNIYNKTGKTSQQVNMLRKEKRKFVETIEE